MAIGEVEFPFRGDSYGYVYSFWRCSRRRKCVHSGGDARVSRIRESVNEIMGLCLLSNFNLFKRGPLKRAKILTRSSTTFFIYFLSLALCCSRRTGLVGRQMVFSDSHRPQSVPQIPTAVSFSWLLAVFFYHTVPIPGNCRISVLLQSSSSPPMKHLFHPICVCT